jgi:Zn-dependent alcohol dehydrogenase
MRHITGAVLNRLGDRNAHEPLTLGPLELADPGPSELLVRIDAAGLCHSDLSVMNGSRPRPVPMVLGHEATGIVEVAGSAVTDIEPGRRVVAVFVPACGRCGRCLGGRPALCARAAAANGEGRMVAGGHRLFRDGAPVHHHLGISAFATHAVVDRSSVVPVDDDIPATTAALFGCAVLTGAGAVLSTARTAPGASVAVIGLGGIGLAAVLAAVLSGAGPIVAVDPVPHKRELAATLGATHTAAPEAASSVVAAAAGGVDIVIEAAGRPAALELGFDLAGTAGRIVAVGLPHPSEHARIPAARLVAESKSLHGSYLGDSVPQRDIPRLVELWRAGRFPVDALRSDVRPLDEINQGFDDLAAGTSVRTVVTS